MSDSEPRRPIASLLVVLALVGGGWYFFRNFEIEGLDQVAVYPKDRLDDHEFVSFGESPAFAVRPGDPFLTGGDQGSSTLTGYSNGDPTTSSSVDASAREGTRSRPIIGPDHRRERARRRRVPNLRVGSWALKGFGSVKLSDDELRGNVVRVIRQFDVVALQQIPATERDVVPLLVDAVNGSSEVKR